VETVVAVYLAVGFLTGLALYAWASVSSVRRHGFRKAARLAGRGYLEELPLNPRTRTASWLLVIALPVIAIWASVSGEWDPGAAVLAGLLWLFYLAMLRWHYRAKARVRRRTE